MMDVCQITISGRLVKEVEIVKFDKGGLAKLTLAVNNKLKKDENGKYTEEASFFNVTQRLSVTESSYAEALKKLAKGAKIIASGKMIQQNFTGKDGAKHEAWTIDADNLNW